ncbi:MAG: THUMP domain-containing protein [Betaproteobacteria bacterium]|uniref:Predicted N6-adenine-specific DNA methylase n=1 Tax=Serpentinimonas maccroryi TaxID=1458426 RepID=A0A060NPD1_9BURK|nr:THUMP domain-containing protein [Serpentinimonas maccroryi]MCL5968603.1 THUMP domain-containing protein [Betaproteobacteria bacterium]MCM2478803.1 RNA methyltransferase [Serpentinimonas maccroryi]BAO84411.1 predicted N6-adenine-specific DNA methylase [Serpentinimonas maccroryi]
MHNLTLFLPCPAGVEDFLLAEVQAICPAAAASAQRQRGGVELTGTWDDVLRLNLHSRLAQRVLVRLALQPCPHEDALYQAAHQVLWELWFTPAQTFKVELTAHQCPFQSLNFAALRIKDAVCDRMRERFGQRPSVDTVQPQVRLHAHLGPDQVWLYIDTSGEPLFKRGWRSDTGDAPLKETLAAAMIAASGWTGLDAQGQPQPLYDPCCGSGTVAIEAAQRALQIAPGKLRRFGFERLLPHRPERWQALRLQAEAAERPLPGGQPLVFGSDVSFRMVDFARRNAERAGVAHAIEWRGGDALERLPPCPTPGVMLLNPPYGERIAAAGVAGQPAQERARAQPGSPPGPAQGAGRESARHADGQENADFFAQLASHWKKHYAGWTAWLLTPDPQLPGQMRLKPSRRVPLWNGPIECRLFRFDLVAGSARTPRAGAGTRPESQPPQ